MPLLLPDFTNARILVAGDIMLDKYWHGSTLRISPEAPVPVVKIGLQDYRPGGAGNVAFNIASLGGHAVLVGFVGDDDAGIQLRSCLAHKNITQHLLAIDGKRTTTKLRVVSQYHQMIRLDFEDNFTDTADAPIEQIFLESLKSVKTVILSDYAKGFLKAPAKLIAHAKKYNLPIIVDPKNKDFGIYRGATILTPNLVEFEAAVGTCPDEKTLILKARTLSNAFDFEAILITRGEQGMILIGRHFEPITFYNKPSQVTDVTGAGDTVVAVLASGLATGQTFADAAAIANIAAGLSVEKFGATTITAQELMATAQKKDFCTAPYASAEPKRPLSTIAEKRELPKDSGEVLIAQDCISIKGIVSEAQLISLVKQAKLLGQRIVMTNGCFDIMHPGHVSYLTNARQLGDKLIVAVNDDCSVRAIKGEGRPLNSLEDRMLMLASLKSVDWVVSFSEKTPERLIGCLDPDILVKGGDYHVDDIVGGEHVKNNGGQVLTLNIVSGYSTTTLIKKIQQTVVERETL